MSGLTVTTDIAEEAWDAFVTEHKDATFFHRAGWRHVLRQAFNHRAYPLAALQRDRLVGVLPLVEVRSRIFSHALISSAFGVAGGPLVTYEPARATLIAHAVELGRKLGVDYIELRDFSVRNDGWVLHSGLYETFERRIAASEDECLSQIPRKQRAVLRRALGESFSVTLDQDVQAFYPLYTRSMRNHGTPAFPQRYFHELIRVFARDCDILTVWRTGIPQGSVLSFYFRDRALPYYTGSLGEARDTGANDLMYWHLMRSAAARGHTVFDFGRSKTGTGAHAFKKNWGFRPRSITHSYHLYRRQSLPQVNPTNPRYAPLIAAWRRLPLPLANLLSRYVSAGLA